MNIDKVRDRNKHIEQIIDYMIKQKRLIPNLYEISDEEFNVLKQEAGINE